MARTNKEASRKSYAALVSKHRQQRKIIIIVCAVLLLSALAIVLILKPWQAEKVSYTSGEAEAVMTTKVLVLDGIWDEKRYSDEFYYPIGIAVQNGALYVADYMSDRVQIVALDGHSSQRVGKPEQYGFAYMDSGALADGWREEALFMKPAGIALAPNGDAVICDTGNNVIRKMDEDYVITIAGNGEAGYKNGREGDVMFDSPRAAAVDEDGIIYVADTLNHCIRRLDKDGNVTLFAGTPQKSGYADGALTDAQFYEPSGLSFAPNGDLYVADAANHCIRKISGGNVTTVAGKPGEFNRDTSYPQGGYTDGLNSEAEFNFPRDVAVLENGSLAVADSMNHAVRIVQQDSTITLAGSGMAGQYYSAAENIKLTRPEGICANGTTVYVSDSVNNRVLGIPLTQRMLNGRPSRGKMLETTGVATTSKYAYNGEIRVYIDDERIDMGRVAPWNTADFVYMPIRPLVEALGGQIALNEKTNLLTITINGQDTLLALDKDYFIMKGIAVTTLDEIVRLFPYNIEWYPEFSLIAIHAPAELAPEIAAQKGE